MNTPFVRMEKVKQAAVSDTLFRVFITSVSGVIE